ncbi:hypothetical protein PSK87_02235 [Escherichia coli]|nr:hypothetical protein [Escherichia coli]
MNLPEERGDDDGKTDVYVFLFRITIVWPSMLTGCVMMLYFAEVAGGGVAGLEQRYGGGIRPLA